MPTTRRQQGKYYSGFDENTSTGGTGTNNFWKKVQKRLVLNPKPTLYLTNDIKTAAIGMLCKNSGLKINQCLEKFSHSYLLNELFQFNKFNNVTFIKKLGKTSANGFVYGINYNEPRFNLSSNAILKSSRKRNADNLVYEYWAGLFINKICDYFPCFLQTYGLYKYGNEEIWKRASAEKVDNASFLKQLVNVCSTYDKHGKFSDSECEPTDICNSAQLFSILVQYVEKPKSMFDYILSEECNSYELNCILFIIYMALDRLKDEFTHYDFHDENCLVYSPYDKYIHYQYYPGDGKPTIEFYTKFVPKIIDYGRAYYRGNDSVIKKLHEEDLYSDCNEKNRHNTFTQRAGAMSGFGSLTNCTTGKPHDNDYICSNIPNRSHDLRLLHLIQTTPDYIKQKTCPHLKGYPEKFDANATSLRLKNILSDVFRENTTVSYGYKNKKGADLDMGTPEKMTAEKGKIVNISDAHEHFKNYLLRRSPVPAELVPPQDEIAGEMHVYYHEKPIIFRKR